MFLPTTLYSTRHYEYIDILQTFFMHFCQFSCHIFFFHCEFIGAVGQLKTKVTGRLFCRNVLGTLVDRVFQEGSLVDLHIRILDSNSIGTYTLGWFDFCNYDLFLLLKNFESQRLKKILKFF